MIIIRDGSVILAEGERKSDTLYSFFRSPSREFRIETIDGSQRLYVSCTYWVGREKKVGCDYSSEFTESEILADNFHNICIMFGVTPIKCENAY